MTVMFANDEDILRFVLFESGPSNFGVTEISVPCRLT